ncbi:hypothetical protein Tco_0241334 [Tanacetum coccineum]
MASVSKSILIPNEEFSDDTSPSVSRKFLNEVKTTIVTLQRVVKQKMTLDIHNWSSTAHQELHKIVKHENFLIVNQVDAIVQNFEIQFLKETAKFVRDFKSLAKEADESLAKHKVLEYEIERLLRAVVSQNIMSIMQSNSVIDTSNLQTELDRTKETCIIKKEKEYVVLWNNWYKKCEECKYDKFSYDKAYNDMLKKIEKLQAQLEDFKGKSQDTPCVSDTLDPLSRKLEDENVSLKFQVLNYAKENKHLKTTYKNLFDSIKVTRAQTNLTKSLVDGWLMGNLRQALNQIREDLLVTVEKHLVLEMIMDESLMIEYESLEMLMDDSLKMIEDESLDMIVDELLEMIEDESLEMLTDDSLEMIENESLEMVEDESLEMIEDESLDTIVDETLKLDE